MKTSPSSSDRLLTYEDWVYLNPGQRVSVQRQREAEATGTIDEVAEDAAYLWVWLDDGRGRVLIFEDDGTAIRI